MKNRNVWVLVFFAAVFWSVTFFTQTARADYVAGKQNLISALEKFQSIGRPMKEENSSYLKRYQDARESFQNQLSALNNTTPPEKERVAASFLLIYGAQALRGMDAIVEGTGSNDKKLIGKGWKLLAFATADINKVTGRTIPGSPSDKTQSGEKIFFKTDRMQISKAPTNGWNPIINWGLNSSASFGDSTLFSFGGQVGPQINRNLDTGVSLTIQSSKPKSGSTTTSVLTSLFGRWSFINMFPKNPQVVPYAGLSIGYRNSSGGYSDSSTVIGIPFGMLWYVSRTKALTLGMELQNPVSGNSTTSTFLMNVGIRFSTPNDLSKLKQNIKRLRKKE